MPIDEIFPNPLVKTVIFEVKFPNLFFLENRIGDIQMNLMSRFPESKLLHRRGFLVANIGPDQNIDDFKDDEKMKTATIWQFYNEKGYRLNILQNKFDITSEFHKTYNLGEENKFRDIIEFVVDVFLTEIDLPKFNRVGLRYIDEGPIIEKNNSVFSEWYNTTLPLERYSIENSSEMAFRTVSKKNGYNIIYREELLKKEGIYSLLLDFDGYAENIRSDSCLEVTDRLHDIISDEFVDKIKEPVYEYMRRTE